MKKILMLAAMAGFLATTSLVSANTGDDKETKKKSCCAGKTACASKEGKASAEAKAPADAKASAAKSETAATAKAK